VLIPYEAIFEKFARWGIRVIILDIIEKMRQILNSGTFYEKHIGIDRPRKTEAPGRIQTALP
jgi:hypothetical protein